MSVPTNADELLNLISKSGQIDEGKLAGFVQAHQHDDLWQQEAKHVAAAMVREGILTYFQAEQFLLGKWRGFELGKYKLLERLGVGGMGQVFLCEHKHMRKRVAVKVLPPTKAEDPVALGRFYREARVASTLDHPNIVHTFDIDQHDALHFLVMEYVDGKSLLEIVKQHGPMNATRAAHYIKQAAVGLQYGHEMGMIHRDIKPGNIMIDRQGTAKLLDMGLARLYRDEKDLLTLKFEDKSVLGTADYVAPEQTRDSRNIDVRADIYGLGATFYFLVAGHPPFPDGTVAEKLIAHQTKKPRPIREVRPEVPQGIAKIIEKMLAKEAADRYQTPAEVVKALEVWTEMPIEPPPAEEMPKLSPAVQTDPLRSARPPASLLRSESALQHTPSVPISPIHAERALDAAATVPFPRKPVVGANPAASSSTVDIGSTPKSPPRPSTASAVDIGETRSLPSDPTPQATAKSPSDASKPLGLEKPKTTFDLKIPGLDLSKLPKSKVPASPSTETPKPPVSVAKPTRLTGSRDVPKPPVVPLPPSKELAGPAIRELRAALTGSTEALNLAGVAAARENPKFGSSPARLGGTPAYQPPDLKAVSAVPGAAEPHQGFVYQLMRWLFMMAISSLIGAGLGTAIWYLFLR